MHTVQTRKNRIRICNILAPESSLWINIVRCKPCNFHSFTCYTSRNIDLRGISPHVYTNLVASPGFKLKRNILDIFYMILIFLWSQGDVYSHNIMCEVKMVFTRKLTLASPSVCCSTCLIYNFASTTVNSIWCGRLHSDLWISWCRIRFHQILF